MQVCTKCQVERDDSRFLPDARTGRLRTVCMDCRNAAQRERIKNDPEYAARMAEKARAQYARRCKSAVSKDEALKRLNEIRKFEALRKAEQVWRFGSKHCTCCLERKLLECFTKDRRKFDGLHSQCKDCRKGKMVHKDPRVIERRKAYLVETRDRRVAKRREYAATLPAYAVAARLGIPLAETPAELLEVKRLQLLIKRHLKEKK